MLTKNYYAFLATALIGYQESGAAAVDTNGNTRMLYNYNSCLANSYNYTAAGAMIMPHNPGTSSSSSGPYNGCLEADISDYSNSSSKPVRFGSGTTPATVDDYKLESVHKSGLTVVSHTKVAQSLKNNVITRTYSYVLKNTTSADVVVGEVGMFYQSYYGESTNYAKFMLDRTVLDEPITIAPGGTGTVVYTLTIKVPTCPTE